VHLPCPGSTPGASTMYLREITYPKSCV
jgi:hypothetical protein